MLIMRIVVIFGVLTRLGTIYYPKVINWEGRIRFKLLFFALKSFQHICSTILY